MGVPLFFVVWQTILRDTFQGGGISPDGQWGGKLLFSGGYHNVVGAIHESPVCPKMFDVPSILADVAGDS